MATIIKRERVKGKPSYFVVHRWEGKQHWIKAGERRIDAERLKTKIEHELHTGAYQQLPNITVKDFCDKWLKSKKADVRAKTYQQYQGHIEGKIIPYFGNRKLKSLRVEEVEAFKASLVESGKISMATVGKALLVLKMLLKGAVVWGYVGRNVAEHVKRPLHRKPKIEFLIPEEIKRLIKATQDEHKCLIATASYSGMRQGEVLALKWGDVDFEKRKIFVNKTLQLGQFLDPKSESSRRAVDIPEVLVEMLKAHQLRQTVEGPGSELNLVFPDEVGRPMDCTNLIVRIFRPALMFANLRSGVTFHSLRHSYASILIDQGANIKYVQKQLGHANITQTLGTYSHLLPDSGKEAIAKMETVFSTDKAVATPKTIVS